MPESIQTSSIHRMVEGQLPVTVPSGRIGQAALPGKDVALWGWQAYSIDHNTLARCHFITLNTGGAMPRDKGKRASQHDKVQALEPFREDGAGQYLTTNQG